MRILPLQTPNTSSAKHFVKPLPHIIQLFILNIWSWISEPVHNLLIAPSRNSPSVWPVCYPKYSWSFQKAGFILLSFRFKIWMSERSGMRDALAELISLVTSSKGFSMQHKWFISIHCSEFRIKSSESKLCFNVRSCISFFSKSILFIYIANEIQTCLSCSSGKLLCLWS